MTHSENLEKQTLETAQKLKEVINKFTNLGYKKNTEEMDALWKFQQDVEKCAKFQKESIPKVKKEHEHNWKGSTSNGEEHTNERYEKSWGVTCVSCSKTRTVYSGIDYRTGKSLNRVEIR